MIARRHGQLEMLQQPGEDAQSDDAIAALTRERMPDGAEALLDATLLRLTADHRWKPMRLVLTEARLAMASADEVRLLRAMPMGNAHTRSQQPRGYRDASAPPAPRHPHRVPSETRDEEE